MVSPRPSFLLATRLSLETIAPPGFYHSVGSSPPQHFLIPALSADLDVSNNRVSSLPDELSNCTALETVNISGNSFIQMPPVLAEIPTLIKVVASKNFIADIEVEALSFLPALEHLNLEGNPLKKEVHDELSRITSIRVILSPREQEEWEDLSC